MYTEGELEVHHSRLDRNVAEECGGALYAAIGGKVDAILPSRPPRSRALALLPSL